MRQKTVTRNIEWTAKRHIATSLIHGARQLVPIMYIELAHDVAGRQCHIYEDHVEPMRTQIGNQHSFFNHVFSTTEEGKAEILNVVQYSLSAILPVVLLNKTVQKFIPEADIEKSSLELLA